jgi:hypothetical protein
MAKFLLFLLTLALFAASNSKHGAVAAATAEDSDLLQRQENMAEVIRVSTSPAAVAAADPATSGGPRNLSKPGRARRQLKIFSNK